MDSHERDEQGAKVIAIRRPAQRSQAAAADSVTAPEAQFPTPRDKLISNKAVAILSEMLLSWRLQPKSK